MLKYRASELRIITISVSRSLIALTHNTLAFWPKMTPSNYQLVVPYKILINPFTLSALTTLNIRKPLKIRNEPPLIFQPSIGDQFEITFDEHNLVSSPCKSVTCEKRPTYGVTFGCASTSSLLPCNSTMARIRLLPEHLAAAHVVKIDDLRPIVAQRLGRTDIFDSVVGPQPVRNRGK